MSCPTLPFPFIQGKHSAQDGTMIAHNGGVTSVTPCVKHQSLPFIVAKLSNFWK